MQMVDVIRAGIPGEAQNRQAPAANLTELLHAAGTPRENGRPREPERTAGPPPAAGRSGMNTSTGLGSTESILNAMPGGWPCGMRSWRRACSTIGDGFCDRDTAGAGGAASEGWRE
ncbi:MAG: hypothetical protein ACR2L6_01210 [Gemmatimonadaceae bacterium]